MKISEKKWMNLMKKLNLNLFSLLFIFFLSLTNLANSEEKFIAAWANNITVIDGDTIKIGKEKIRLFGIDAPEIKQICKNKNNDPYACGEASRDALRDLIKKIYEIYNKISKELIVSKDIRAAETAKVIENIQRDLNIALMNEILLVCKKLKINFNEVIRLAKSKWNFMNFMPGLVGGHCLPVDPYYLSTISKKNNLNTEITLAGRKINDGMINYITKELNYFLNKKNKTLKNSKIMIVGLTYKAGVADMRNSLNFKIFKKIKKYNNKIHGCDPFVTKNIKTTYGIYDNVKKNTYYDAILFLSYNKIFKKIFKKIVSSDNKNKILDPFNYYS